LFVIVCIFILFHGKNKHFMKSHLFYSFN